MSHDVTHFQTEVIERSRKLPVVVDFWAAWCGPCRVLGPVLERLAEQAGGRWALAKVDTELLTDVAAKYAIQSIPAVKLFVNGEVIDEFVGALPEGQIRKWLDRALPSPHAAALSDATRMLDAGRFAEARPLVEDVLSAEPGNRDARVLLARTLVHSEPAAVDAALQPLADDAERADGIETLHTLGRVATFADSPERLPAGRGRDRFLEGATALRRGDFASAFEAFIDVLGIDRQYADGLARDAGRAIILLLGLDHPVVDAHFRAFSSAVNR